VAEIKAEDIIIDEEFLRILPRLDDYTFSGLEDSIVQNGVTIPLVLWNGILIDGHHRLEICIKHNLPFEVTHKEFDSREEALIWIITNQVLRRNLAPMHLSYFRGRHYNADKMIQGSLRHSSAEIKKGQNDLFYGTTAARLSDVYNVSPKTIQRDARIAETIDAIGDISSDAKKKILSGKGQISRIRLEELSSVTSDELSETIDSILDGTHQRHRRRVGAYEPDKIGGDASGKSSASLMVLVSKLLDDFNDGIKSLNNKEDPEEVKPAIRSLIDLLEELYGRI